MKEYDICSLLYLFECYSNNADEVVQKLDKYVEEKGFTEEEKAKFFFDMRTQGTYPFVSPKYEGGNLTEEEFQICERIKKKHGIDKL